MQDIVVAPSVLPTSIVIVKQQRRRHDVGLL